MKSQQISPNHKGNPTLDNQYVFNLVISHFANQKAPSMNFDTGNCYYKDGNGLMCAIGCLIPDDIYSPNMEGKDIRDLIKENDKLNNHFKNCNEWLLFSLQTFHDDQKNWNLKGLTLEGIERLQEVAKDFEISPSLVKKLFLSN